MSEGARLPAPLASVSVTDTDRSAALLAAIISSLEDSKAEEIVAIDIAAKTPIADHMVVASGRSHRHVAAIAEHLLSNVKDAGFGNAAVEGLTASDWVLIDAGDVIVHVFRPEVRTFYNIEKMWADPDGGRRLG
nr:ribosome silencing factor [Methylobrevis pamukkalensis]